MADQPYYNPEEYDADVRDELQSDESLLAVMRQRFSKAEEAEAKSRIEELDDLRFSNGDQWPDEVKNRRRMDGRPCLVINQMPQFIRQVTNEQRQNRPQIRAIPVDDTADVETAKVLQGLIRHIEVDSDADIAYNTAFDHSVRSGKGYFRVITEYVSEKSFEQCIKIRRIRNRFAVYMDPDAQQPDGSDSDWGMIFETISREEFTYQWPDSEVTSMPSWTTQGDGWVDKDTVRIAEYFFCHRVKREVCLLDDGTVEEKRLLPENMRGRKVVDSRQAFFPEIWWVKTNGYEVLDKERFPGRYVPIIPVIGDEVDIDGKVEVSGIVRHGKDAARMYNYFTSSETETIALAPRSPWVGAEGQFEGHEAEWQAANNQNIAFLEYKLTSHTDGTPLPPPQRNNFEPNTQAITQARLLARDDVKATTGIHDASLGARSNETSGRAIVARQREGDVANFHHADNLAKSLRQCGRIIIDIIPEIYTGPRILRILGEDNTPRQVELNNQFTDEDGIDRIFDVGVGRYDVVVDVGPSFATKRQETVSTMIELTKTYPALFQVAGDLLIKNMDWPGAQDIADRLMSLLPPELRPSGDPSNPKEELAQLRAAIPQLQEQLKALNEYAKQCEAEKDDLEQKNGELTVASKSKAAELTLKEEEAAAKDAIEQQKLELEREKLTIERQKLEIEEQRLALEVAEARANMALAARNGSDNGDSE
ncbi:MAG: portal protein [Gammaproteobacteria bacterium]